MNVKALVMSMAVSLAAVAIASRVPQLRAIVFAQ